ncbi:hypothetical protein LENED_003922 [Lentinula edodes]|uniref:Uncharacterized protein n=1 Tax=Lentinula edodes TaxID=5353 RepID=A0A1Q3E4V7_LENED|nr:hypothetical protein LENED_003922 [Lentinula edodes]
MVSYLLVKLAPLPPSGILILSVLTPVKSSTRIPSAKNTPSYIPPYIMPSKFSFSHAFLVLILLSTLLGGICYPFSLPGTFDTKTHLESRGSDVRVGLRYQEPSAFYPLPARYWSFWLNAYGFDVKQEIEHDVFKVDILSEKRYRVGTSLGTFHIDSSRRDLPALTKELQNLPGQLWPVDCFNLIFEKLKEKELMMRVPEDWTKLYNENLEMGAIQLKREIGSQIIPLFDNHVDPTQKWTIYIGTKHGFAAHSSPGKPSKFIETNEEFKGGILVDTIFTSKMHLDSILQEAIYDSTTTYYKSSCGCDKTSALFGLSFPLDPVEIESPFGGAEWEMSAR